MNEGWISLHRQIRENGIWKHGVFSRGQAWVDLLLLANHEEKWIMVRGIKVTISRGQVGWSEPRLAQEWGWSRSKLRLFLKLLENEQQIEQQKNNVTSVITIVNYGKYQDQGQQKEPHKDSRKTAERQQKDPNNNDNNENNENKRESVVASNAPTPAQVVRDFFTNETSREKIIQELIAKGFPEEDARREIKKFCSYWTERNKSGQKERWELQKTYELRRRLKTWLSNFSKFSPSHV